MPTTVADTEEDEEGTRMMVRVFPISVLYISSLFSSSFFSFPNLEEENNFFAEQPAREGRGVQPGIVSIMLCTLASADLLPKILPHLRTATLTPALSPIKYAGTRSTCFLPD